MSESHRPSPAESRLMMSSAIAEVKAAQQRLREERTGEGGADPTRESLRPTETIAVQPASSGPVEQWREKYPKTYERILRAAARSLEHDDETRHRIYALLHCAPKEQD